MDVPFVDLKAQYNNYKAEIDSSIAQVLSDTAFVLGPHVKEFEKGFSAYLNSKHCAGVSNATDALYLAFSLLGVGDGDEVIIPANTFVATAVGVIMCGGTPVLVDMDADTYLIDYSKIEAAITPKTKAICPVHLYGRACDMDKILDIAKKHDLTVVEDVAQSPGAKWKGKCVGTFGDFGCFSFYPGKNLGAYGDAGAVTTQSDEFNLAVRSKRNFGSERKYEYPEYGINARLSGIQAAVLNVKLKYLDKWNSRRWDIASKYSESFADLSKNGSVKLPDLVNKDEHVFHLFVIEVDDPKVVNEGLSKQNIASNYHYPFPFHLQPGYEYLGYKEGSFPNTEKASKRLLSLPIYPDMTDEQVDYVIDNFKKLF